MIILFLVCIVITYVIMITFFIDKGNVSYDDMYDKVNGNYDVIKESEKE